MGATPKRTLLVLGHVWPEPQTTAAGQRMIQLIQSFQKASYNIYFASSAAPSDHSLDLIEIGIKTILIRINDSDFDTMIRELQPDIVIFDRFMTEEQFGWRVAEHAPNSLRILNTEDLHSLRKARREALVSSKECTPAYWLSQKDTLRELASILRCDLSFLISEEELKWLRETGIISNYLLFYLPFMLGNVNISNTDIYGSFNDRKNFMFVGHGKHKPNEDAVHYLKETIWPLIHSKLPEVRLTIYGDGYSSNTKKLHDPKTGFYMAGWTEDLQDIMSNARLNLAPLRFGAGLKGKIVSAIAAGTPSLMTTIGAEGILPYQGFDYCIADDPDAFVTKALDLYTNPSASKAAQSALQAHYNVIFDRERHHLRLHNQLEKAVDSVELNRNSNIVGRMLHSQSLNSQKYMAKWIEAKNKLEQSGVVQ
ncbi:MAG: glycosyltransferase [Eudoraea sp.]|nr:glycosyltransferase [Eudoraea sp.]